MAPFLEPSSPKPQILEKTKSNEYKKKLSSFLLHVPLHQFAWLLITLLFQILFIMVYTTRTPRQLLFLNQQQHQHQQQLILPVPIAKDYCKSGLVYIYDLPSMFNKELMEKCDNLDPWRSLCITLANQGFGPKATSLKHIVPQDLAPMWYWTDMFAGEVVFHTRISTYKCATSQPELASAFYVPFYAGLAATKYLLTNSSARERDWHSEMLLRWLQNQPFWKRSNGSDHFIMLGRPTWDFRRSNDGDWGSSFLRMPAMKQILRLSVERNVWDPLDISVPYPTGFHLRVDSDIIKWQRFVRASKRRSLFTFVGAKRKVNNDFRALLMDICNNETGSCRVVDCSKAPCNDGTSVILEAFLDSNFCLQPRGDAHTRKSMFDCMLAGTIPVFFWERSIRGQYEWFLGNEPESFSVFIDRNDVRNGTSIRRVLEGYSVEDVERMRERVIELIPRFAYAMPGDNGQDITRDAFEIAMEGVLRKFMEQRRDENASIQMD